MKICIVGPANSAHILKWCTWFSTRGYEVHVISFSPGIIPGTKVHFIDAGVNTSGSDIGKLKYMLKGKQIKRLLAEIQPDIINAHYATSYGVAMALSGIRRYVLSIWGSDIYDFPRKSILHKALLSFSLKKAGYLFSTSQAMADEAGLYTDRQFEITPFGVDTDLFNPKKRSRIMENEFIVGTIKGLSDTYGIQYILKAVAQIKNQGEIPIRLRIAGKGPKELEYKKLASDLKIADITEWLGFISQEQAAIEWANMDVAIIPSEAESFGVSAVEAQACGTPVIISDIPGLMEATKPGETSIVVKRNEHEEIAKAITYLYINKERRVKLGAEGVRYVYEQYELNKCFEHIETCFLKYIATKG